MTQEYRSIEGFEPIHETVGDMTLSFITRHGTAFDPDVPIMDQLKLEVSRSGSRRTLTFPGVVRELDAFKAAVTELADHMQDMDIDGSGGDADDTFEPVDRMVADVRISLVRDGDTPVLELATPQGDKEVFYTVLRELDVLRDLVTQIDVPDGDAESSSTQDAEPVPEAGQDATGVSAKDTIDSILAEDGEPDTGTGAGEPSTPGEPGENDISDSSEDHMDSDTTASGEDDTELADSDADADPVTDDMGGDSESTEEDTGSDATAAPDTAEDTERAEPSDADRSVEDGAETTGEADTDGAAEDDGERESEYDMVLEVIEEIAGDVEQQVPIEDVVDAAADRGIDEEMVRTVISRLGREGKLYQPESGHVQLLELSCEMQPEYTATVKQIVRDLEDDDEAVPTEDVITAAENQDIAASDASQAINWLKKEGKIFEPTDDHLMTI